MNPGESIARGFLSELEKLAAPLTEEMIGKQTDALYKRMRAAGFGHPEATSMVGSFRDDAVGLLAAVKTPAQGVAAKATVRDMMKPFWDLAPRHISRGTDWRGRPTRTDVVQQISRKMPQRKVERMMRKGLDVTDEFSGSREFQAAYNKAGIPGKPPEVAKTLETRGAPLLAERKFKKFLDPKLEGTVPHTVRSVGDAAKEGFGKVISGGRGEIPGAASRVWGALKSGVGAAPAPVKLLGAGVGLLGAKEILDDDDDDNKRFTLEVG